MRGHSLGLECDAVGNVNGGFYAGGYATTLVFWSVLPIECVIVPCVDIGNMMGGFCGFGHRIEVPDLSKSQSDSR